MIPFSPIVPLTDTQQRKLADVIAFVSSNQCNTQYAKTGLTDEASLAQIQPKTFRAVIKEAPDAFVPYAETRDVLGTLSTEDENPFLYPVRIDAQWNLIQQHIKEKQVRVVSGIFPILWQLGPLLYYTCRLAHVTASMLPQKNVLLVKQVIRETESTCIVTTPEIAAELMPHIEQSDLTWVLVTTAGGSNPDYPGITSIIEHHVAPGIAVGIAKGERGYVPNDSYIHEVHDGNVYITSLNCDAYPLMRCHVGTQAVVSHVDGVTVIAYESV
jgi:hypothetical protein